MSWYTEGTVTVTNGSATVHGVGTRFDLVRFADILMVDSKLFEIDHTVSATELVLRKPITVANGANLDYAIMRNMTNANNYDLLVEIEQFVNNRQAQLDEFAAWANGPANGGPASDGRFPLTDRYGVVHMIFSPLHMQATTGTVPDMSSQVAALQTTVQDLQDALDAIPDAAVQKINLKSPVGGVINLSAADVGAQAQSSILSALAGQTWAKNKIAYSMGATSMNLANFTALGRQIIGCETPSELAAVLASAVVTEAPQFDPAKRYHRGAGQWFENTVLEAPFDHQFYGRQDGKWTKIPAIEQFYDIGGYWAATELGPNNTLLKVFPRQFLSSPIFSESFIRREIVSNSDMVFSVNNTSGTWNAKAVIPAGENEGYFIDFNTDFLGAGDGVTIRPDVLPMPVIQGLSITLRFKVKGDAATEPNPVPTSPDAYSLFYAGLPKSSQASVGILNTDTFEQTYSVDRNFVVAKGSAFAASPDGKLIAMINGNGTVLMIIDAQTRTTIRTFTGTFAQAMSWRPDSKALLVHQSGNLIVYDSTTWAMLITTPTGSMGLGTINSIRYSGSGRVVGIAHTNGVTALNTTFDAWTVYNWVGIQTFVGQNILDVNFDSGVTWMVFNTSTTLNAIAVRNGIQMPATRWSVPMTSLNNMTWNDAASTDSVYPFMLISGNTATEQNVVAAFFGDGQGLKQIEGWKIVAPRPIRGLIISPSGSTRGRQAAVAYDLFEGNLLSVHDLLSAEKVAEMASTVSDGIRGMSWYKLPGAAVA